MFFTSIKYTTFFKIIIISVFFSLALGCKQKDVHTPSLDEKYFPDEEETIEILYTPRDDGKPLSPAELKAFRSSSSFDKDLSQEDAEIVELHFKYFVHENRRTFERYLARSSRYLPYVKKIFSERGLPEDLAYLFMIESGGNPNAVSPVGATGLWQFMPFTGKKFGLEQSSWYDARRDPFRATYAASDYLLKLYGDFGDWHLAAAAYNAGEGKIGRGIKGTGATDFFELCRLDCVLEEKARLREETRLYVPRLIAIAKVMRNLKLLGFEEPSPNAAYDLTPIQIPPGTNLSAFARNLDLTWAEFSAMNPAFKRTASPPHLTVTAYIPPENLSSAEAWLLSKEARTYANVREHTIKRKETLAGIAKRYKVKVADIKSINGIESLPSPGNVIIIPGKDSKPETVYSAMPEKGSTAKPKAGGSYVVKSGDSLFSLAQSWGTDVKSIVQANRLGSETIVPGQRLNLPANSKTPPVLKPAAGTGRQGLVGGKHTVVKNDTLFSISQKYGVSVDDILKANNMSKKSSLSIGKKLTIPSKEKPSQKPTTPATTTPKQVTVKKGDTLFSISKKYNVKLEALRKLNNLKENSRLRVGMKINLP